MNGQVKTFHSQITFLALLQAFAQRINKKVQLWHFFWMGQSQTLCLYFGIFLNSNWQTYVWKLSLPLLGFELRISGVGSDCSAYCLVRHNHIRLQRWHNRRIIRWLYVGLQQLKFMNVSNNPHPTKNVYCCQILSIINSFLSYTIKADLHNMD